MTRMLSLLVVALVAVLTFADTANAQSWSPHRGGTGYDGGYSSKAQAFSGYRNPRSYFKSGTGYDGGYSSKQQAYRMGACATPVYRKVAYYPAPVVYAAPVYTAPVCAPVYYQPVCYPKPVYSSVAFAGAYASGGTALSVSYSKYGKYSGWGASFAFATGH